VDHDAALATALGDRPVISLLRPDAAVGPVSTEVSGWVAHYLAVLDELPVEPPDWLLSWSFGVVVALEVARALSERGIEVAYVGMTDAIKPLRFSEQFRLLARKVRSIDGWRARLHHVDDRLRIVVAQLRADIKENRGEAARHLGLRSKRAPTTRSATKDTFATAVHASYLAYRPQHQPRLRPLMRRPWAARSRPGPRYVGGASTGSRPSVSLAWDLRGLAHLRR